MFRKKIFGFIAVIAAFSLLFAGCGSKEDQGGAASTESATEVLNLSEWSLSATTWSSPNGATVHLVATPAGYVKGQTAFFTARLEGEEVQTAQCEWDGSHYTASLDLNGEDGYCYYVMFTGSTGEKAEIPVNIASSPVDESLVNLASSLESSCALVVESSDYNGSRLTITGGSVSIKPPKLKPEGKAVTCTQAVLTLSLDGQESGQMALDLPEPAADGSYTLALTDASFQTPAMEDDQQLTMTLTATLSNGQILTASGGTWFYNAGELMLSVG